MRHSLLRFFVPLLLAAPLTAQAKVRVAATIGDLAALTRAVGGDLVDVTTLSTPTEDPHFVDAKPDRVLLLSRADLLVFTGLDLEIGWLPVLLTGSRNANVQPGTPGFLDCSTLISPKEVPLQKIDRSMGDIHPGGNPHYTKDPHNAELVARGISQRLAELDPSHTATYQKNEAELEKTLDAKIIEWTKALAPYKAKPVITYHKSWIYFSDWAGLDQVGFIEPKPGIPPSTSHVANLFSLMKAKKVDIILQEQWYSAQTSELLAKNTGARVVRVPGMAGLKQSYVDYMDEVVSDVLKGLHAS